MYLCYNHPIKMKHKSIKFGLIGVVLVVGCLMNAPFSSASEPLQRHITFTSLGEEWISPILTFEEPFNALSVMMESETKMEFEVNFSPERSDTWEPAEAHDDGFGTDVLLFTKTTQAVQFKKTAEPGERAFEIDVNVFTGLLDPPSLTPLAIGSAFSGESQLLASSMTVQSTAFSVITRSKWGADETMRYWNPDATQQDTEDSEKEYADPCGGNGVPISKVLKLSPSGDPLIWPLQYTDSIQKFIIHHTDSEIRDVDGDNQVNSRDYKAIVRAIHQFHTVTRGWGDIGYNYIIDPLGNIYEGRFGGDKVVGAHALCHNAGTVGIAIIGNYENNDVPEPAMQAVIALIAKKAQQYNLDPRGGNVFHGKQMANILGHRDVRATACPGNKLYGLLGYIRERADLIMRGGSFNQDFDLTTLDYNADLQTEVGNFVFKPNEKKALTLNFKNTGKKAWDENTWLHVALNNNPNARVISVLPDKTFVAANMEQKSVQPGQTGTFTVELEAGYAAGSYTFDVSPVVNGRYKISRATTSLAFRVQEPDFSYAVVRDDLPKNIIFRGQKLEAWIELKNTGNVTWTNYGAHQITLGTESPRDRKSILVKENPSRLGYLLESEVPPGKTGRFVMALEIPAIGKRKVIERFSPVIEGVHWLENKGLGFEAEVKIPRHRAIVTQKDNLSDVLPGEIRKVHVQMENRGDLPWDPENMSITLLGRGIKVFKTRLVPEKTVKNGEKADFEFWIQAPYATGESTIFLRPTFNRSPISGGTIRFLVTIPKSRLRAQAVEQSDRSVTVRPNEEKEVTVQFKNIGNTMWVNNGPNAIYLAPSNPQDRMSDLYYPSEWMSRFRTTSMKEAQVKPGEIGTFTFKIRPTKTGVKKEYFQLVVEKVGWITSGSVRWDFRIFGETMTKSDSERLNDAKENAKRAALITTVRRDTPIRTQPVTTPKTTPEPAVNKTPTPSKNTATDTFRVRLSYEEVSAVLTANTAFRVTNGEGKTLFTVAAGTPVKTKKMGNKIQIELGSQVKVESIVRIVPEADGVTEIVSMERRPTWNMDLNDNRFRNVIEVRVIDEKVAYINELPLEMYMRGLAEVSNGTPLEKQKAIAVLARSYARFYMSDSNRKFPGMPYDGSDDPAIFQRYLGYGVEQRSPQFVGAVVLTENEVVTYGGKLIKTPYFSQSDGRTRSAEEVWGWKDTPYLQSVSDPYCEGLELKGHGVGLSGCGADGMAKEGKTYDDIIKYYFRGVEIKELSIDTN